ncbi:RND family efflux transporter MFP subunit [Xanthobacter flavus]|uniref:MexE family multidrug efflux RND transporter periplasmic adaptor subunit n=1 Tax=Xanthobacter flavus TaxID=281 RepID=A0A9W6CIW4_XANFL|nr:efflux RND transporter periplasmic adaptor subunit [Xanthobacter flavus]MDR6333268.1 RND family efflux transporter MFP subunit [Xanthobacter flavus]GLI21544.1 MexE family multidrug efflux RND transporter periplasmic adaptor subunit [Xanthobacter flavus]
MSPAPRLSVASHFASAAAAVPVLALALALAGCGQPTAQQQGAPPPPQVTVANPTSANVTDTDEYVGRFVAIDEVNVRARVSGYLDKIDFVDGQLVKEGDVLFTIDQRPFKIAVDQAQANLAQAKANLDFTKADLERARTLLEDKTSNAISKQAFDQRTQAERTAAAIVQSQEAQVRSAQLDLGFTEVKAPVSGQIGDRRVSVGNYVTGGTGGTPTLLAVIVSTDPIRFEFTIDEASLLRLTRRMGGTDFKGDPVALKLIDDKDFVHKGKLDFLNNVVDRETGTIRGRAIFDNKTGLFRPGMFARIRLQSSDPYQALVVPDVAIGTEQVKKFVYVVGPDNKVSQKFVTLGPLQGDMRVIREGLGPDDKVVVNGLMRVRPGVTVTPQVAGAAPAAGAPGAPAGSSSAASK